jgi:lysophospholipase
MDWPARGTARGNLLFAGGRGDFIEKYLPSLHHWRSRGWNVTAFDWRGQGGSQREGGTSNPASFDPLIDDLAGITADARADVVIGHSMGGHLVLRALAEGRLEVGRVVLVAPMIEINSAPFPAATAAPLAEFMCLTGLRDVPMWKTPPPGTPWWKRRQASLTRSADLYSDELYWWEREPGFHIGPPSWGWTRAAYRSAASWFTPEKLAAIETPILILAAARDRLVSAAAIRRVAAALPRAELHVYAHAAHEILRDSDDVRLDAYARIDAFLKGPG